MEGRMKVCVLTGKQKLEWVERDIPQPAAGELQIKLEYVGICGSDLHFSQEGQLATWTRWVMSRAVSLQPLARV